MQAWFMGPWPGNMRRNKDFMQIGAAQAAAGDAPEIVALVDRASADDALAAGELFAHYAGFVYERAYYLVGHHHDPENITGDVFVRAWQSIGRRQGGVRAVQMCGLLRMRELLAPYQSNHMLSPG